MDKTMQDIAASPLEIEIGGEVSRFSPLTIGDMADFEQWTRQRRIAQALESCGDDRDMRQAIILSVSGEPDTGGIQTALMTVAGQLHAIYLSARHNHPDLDERILGDQLTAESMIEILMRLGVLGVADEGKPRKNARRVSP
jgi:hypothetical protein